MMSVDESLEQAAWKCTQYPRGGDKAVVRSPALLEQSQYVTRLKAHYAELHPRRDAAGLLRSTELS